MWTPTLESLARTNPVYPFKNGSLDDLPPDFVRGFLECFYMRYAHRNIAFDLATVFENRCSGRMIERKQYYQEMIASIGVIENPFTNQMVQQTAHGNDAARFKNINTNNTQELQRSEQDQAAYGLGFETGNTASAGANRGSDEQVHKTKSLERKTNDQKTTDKEQSRFSDTPQVPLGQTTTTGDDDTQAVWNDDYLTTASTDNKVSVTGQTQYGADTKTGIDSTRTTGESTSQTADERSNTTRNVTNQAAHSHAQHTGNSLTVNARVSESNASRATTGMTNVLVSDAVIAWREQMLPLLEKVVDDYNDFFLTVF